MTNSNPEQVGMPLTEQHDRQWASFAHLGGILSFLPALIIWLLFKDRGRFTDREAKEALNFQIAVVLASVALSIVITILTVITLGLFGLLAPILWFALWATDIVFSVQGFLRAKDGQGYRYPITVRLIK